MISSREILFVFIFAFILGFVLYLVINTYKTKQTKEGWATSPGTLDQLASSSTEYPFWQYQYGFRYPPNYYFVWPYYQYYPYYEQYALWPKPYDPK